MLRAVLFDLDHTLYDREATFARLAPDFAARFRPFLRAGAEEARLGGILWEADCATCNKTNWVGMHAMFVQGGLFVRDPGFDAFMDFFLQAFPPAITPYADTWDSLAMCRARGFLTGLITNGSLDFQNRKIDAMGLREKMDFCMVAMESGASKPDPAPFLYAAAKLGVAAADCLYVGDNPRNDVWGAKNAGMQAVWFHVLDNWDAALEPAPSIRALSELAALLPQGV